MASMLETLLLLNKAGIRPGNLPVLPRPAMPVPLGPLEPPNAPVSSFELPPDVAPAAPLPALDESLISRIAGTEPAAPVMRQPGGLERFGTALLGVSAGLGGRGGEFAAQLREERERPQREYRAERERFETRRAQGVELAERRREREQDRLTRDAERKADREFDLYKMRSGITDKLALDELDRAHEMAKLRESERIAAGARIEKERADNEKRRQDIQADLIVKQFAPTKIAREIAESAVYDKPLSPAAEKWRSLQAQKLQAQLNKLTTGGGTASGESKKAEQAMANFQAALDTAIAAKKRGSREGFEDARRKLDAAFGQLSRYGGLIEAGIGDGNWPYAKWRGARAQGAQQQQPAASQGQMADPLGIR